MRSMPQHRMDRTEGENGIPPSLYLDLHTRLWVWSLGTTWEGVGHPRPLGLLVICVARPYLIKEFIKRVIILNLNMHHALK